MAGSRHKSHKAARTGDAVISAARSLPWWLQYRSIALVWSALLVYGTLLPFQFMLESSLEQAGSYPALIGAVLTSPRWIAAPEHHVGLLPAWMADVLINVLLYGPIGVCLRLDFRRRGWRWRDQILLTALSLAAISYLLECMQSLEPSRVASLVDVLTNTAGGVVAAVFAARLKRAFMRSTFWLFCRTAAWRLAAGRLLAAVKCRPGWVLAVALVDAVLVGAWLFASVPAYSPSPEAALPFERAYRQPYDVAAWQLGRTLGVYCLLAMLLSMQLLGRHHRRRLSWLLLAVALLAGAREILRGGSSDHTEIILALMAAGLVLTMALFTAHAVQRCCRRRVQVPVAVERRRAVQGISPGSA